MKNVFSLLKFELAMPYIEAVEKKDPKAFISLAAIAIADEESIKLIHAGNEAIFNTIKEKVYSMPYEEVAELLANFISGSKKFHLIIAGLTPEESTQLMKKQEKALKETLNS